MSVGAALLLLAFGMALAYAAGRSDRRDLTLGRRHPHDLDSFTVVQLHRRAAARKAAPRRRG